MERGGVRIEKKSTSIERKRFPLTHLFALSRALQLRHRNIAFVVVVCFKSSQGETR